MERWNKQNKMLYTHIKLWHIYPSSLLPPRTIYVDEERARARGWCGGHLETPIRDSLRDVCAHQRTVYIGCKTRAIEMESACVDTFDGWRQNRKKIIAHVFVCECYFFGSEIARWFAKLAMRDNNVRIIANTLSLLLYTYCLRYVGYDNRIGINMDILIAT